MFHESGLVDKAVIITGGTRGIGRACVDLFSADKADVTFFFRDSKEIADELVTRGRAEGRRITAEQVDVRDRKVCEAAVERVAARCDRIDVLINNSGVIRDNLLPMLEDDDVETVLDTNIAGVFNVTRAVVPHMISRRAGKIINVSSVSAEKGGRGQTNYAASKGAINAFTKALAVELAPRRITVNAVAPGVIETDMSRDILERAADEVKSRILLRRFGMPMEVAYAIMFLASKYGDYITGQVLHVDGGFKME